MAETVFISYKHDDSGFEEELCRWIDNQEGLTGWYDRYILGGDQWEPTIDNHLQDAMCVIVIITPDALKSHYITYEWSYAIALDIPVIPLLIKYSGKPVLHPQLIKINWVDFRKEPRWDRLSEALNKIRHLNDVSPAIITARNIILTSNKQEDWQPELIALKEDTSRQSIDVLAELLPLTINSPIKSIAVALAFAEKTNYLDERPIEALVTGIIRYLSPDLAAQALAKIGTAKATERLIAAFDQVANERKARNILVEVLRYSKDERARLYLEQELSQGQYTVDAAIGLGEIGSSKSVPLLITMLSDPRIKPALKTHLANALRNIGDPLVVPELIKITDQYTRYNETVDHESIAAILVAIGKLNTDEGNLALKRYLRIVQYQPFVNIIINSMDPSQRPPN